MSATCPSVYPPSADAPHEGGGWSGPLRCVLSDGHGDDQRADHCPFHWNTGIHWTDEPTVANGPSRTSTTEDSDA